MRCARCVRINVLGAIATLLMDSEKEYVVLETDKVDTQPTVPTRVIIQPDEYFGEKDTGCDFDPLPSLERKGISHDLVCSLSPAGAALSAALSWQERCADDGRVWRRSGQARWRSAVRSGGGMPCEISEEELVAEGTVREDVSPSKRYTAIA